VATDLYSNAFADNFRLGRSKTFAGRTSGTYNAIRIPKFAFVTDVWLYVKTGYTGGGAVSVGFVGNGETADVDAYITAAVGIVTTTKDVFRAVEGSAAKSSGHWFDSASGVITFTYDDTSVSVVGAFIVFCAFSVIV
jgi:hypothetical protein